MSDKPQKSFDVALVDPQSPSVEHWPRARVTVDAATIDDLTAEQRAPPPGGESADAETKRLAFLVAEIERKRAIVAYDAMYGLTTVEKPMLRYDVVDAHPDSPAPVEPEEWATHRENIGLIPKRK